MSNFSLERDASLVKFSRLHPLFASLFRSSLLSIFQSYILASRVYFSRVSCLLFNPTSLLRESILVGSIVYFSILNCHFVIIFQQSLLSSCVNIPTIPVVRTRTPLVWQLYGQDWHRRNRWPNSHVTKICHSNVHKDRHPIAGSK